MSIGFVFGLILQQLLLLLLPPHLEESIHSNSHWIIYCLHYRSHPAALPKQLQQWIPVIEKDHRSYVTVAIGCTGGQHRSVFLCEKLGRHFQACGYNVQVRHKELV